MKALTYTLFALGVLGTVGYLSYLSPQFDKQTLIKKDQEETLDQRTKTEKKRKAEHAVLTKKLEEQIAFSASTQRSIDTLNADIVALNKEIKKQTTLKKDHIIDLAEDTVAFENDHDELMNELRNEFGSFSVSSVPGQLQRKQSEESSLAEKRNTLLADIDAENDTLEATVAQADIIREYFTTRRSSLKINNLSAKIIEYDQQWGIIRIDAGSSDGLLIGMDIIISSDAQAVGISELIEVSDNSALAKISNFFINKKVLNDSKEPYTLIGKEIIIANILTK